MRGIVTHYTAYATQRTVSIYEGDRRVTYTHGDFAGTNHGVNLDLASEALEQLGYTPTPAPATSTPTRPSRFRWPPSRDQRRGTASSRPIKSASRT
jgi:hypothetical protein